MQGKKQLTPKLMYQVQLDNMVAQDNYYRKLDLALDLRFLYKETASYYGTEGQISIDPVVFFKLCLVGYLNNINSDRKIIEYSSNCFDIRLYIKYDIDEELPWHGTIGRTRNLFGEEVFLSLFKRVLSLCVQKCMVRGKRQAIDSALIKANASLDSLLEKEVVDDAEYYLAELNNNSEYKVSETQKKMVEQNHRWKKEEGNKDKSEDNKDSGNLDEHGNLIRPKHLSNSTHYSSTDPDAKISTKPGKARQLNYLGQIAVDDKHHVITGAMADFADKRDCQSLPDILSQSIDNLNEHNIQIEQVIADGNYSSGKAIEFCEDNNIDAYIPNHGQYNPERKGFVYDKENDRYLCTRGNHAELTFRRISTDNKSGCEQKVYISNNSKCKTCSLRTECIGKSDFKKIVDSIYKPNYDKMHKKMQTKYAKRLMKKRSCTVEPVLGTLINFLDMKRVNTRGISLANKHVLMSALTYNLKKYLKFTAKKTTIQVQTLYRKGLCKLDVSFFRFITSILTKPDFSLLKSK